MKKQLTYYTIFSVILGGAIYTASKLKIALPKIVQFYVNDFLIIPIVLTLCLLVIRWLRNDKNYVIPLRFILYLCVLYSVFFEWYLPKIHPRYTADIIDVLLYFLGGFVFCLLQKRA